MRGELPAGRNRRDDVEIYDRDRFFTVTDERVVETPEEVAHRQDAVAAVHHEYVQTAGNDAVTLEDVTEMTVSRNGDVDTAASSDEKGDGGSRQPIGPNSGLHQKFGRDAPAVDDPALEAALHGFSPARSPNVIPQTLDDVAGPGVALSDADFLEPPIAGALGEGADDACDLSAVAAGLSFGDTMTKQ